MTLSGVVVPVFEATDKVGGGLRPPGAQDGAGLFMQQASMTQSRRTMDRPKSIEKLR